MHTWLWSLFVVVFFSLSAESLPENMLSIMQQPKYAHSTWGLYVKDTETGQVLYDLNSEQMFLPASTTKLFSVEALLHAYGDSYRFKTPVYVSGSIQDGILHGDLILVGQGDLTFGGRQGNTDTIAFTTLDHVNANEIPGVTLTPQDPLHGLNELAKQIEKRGIKEIDGDVLIDDRLFETAVMRGTALSPVFLNENLIDIVVNPGAAGSPAKLSWRPQVPGYSVVNQVKSVSKEESMELDISSDDTGRNIVIKGSIPIDQKDVVRTFSIKDPSHFVREAFIQALRNQGITLKLPKTQKTQLPAQKTLQAMTPLAVWVSPPLSEYAKLILKVSHNTGANLVPLLLAAHEGKRTFDEGMQLLGNFVVNVAKIPPNVFVFIDAAGGDNNRLTPKAEVQLLEYIKKLPADQFKTMYNALPILGVDGSLADFGKSTNAAGKMRAKPGTGMAFNLATHQYFLTTQAFAGYIEGKNGHLLTFMMAVNNANVTAVSDVFAVFEDLSQLSAAIYDMN